MRTKLAILFFMVIAITGAGCANSAPVDEIGLKYGGGPLEGNHFEGVVQPGSGAIMLGPADNIKWLPIGQRNYIVSSKADEGDRATADVITVPAKRGVSFDFEVSVYFKLNSRTNDIKDYNGGTLRKFWEQIGKKYEADTNDGWNRMINDNFRKIIETSMRTEVFNYTADELYANEEGEASGDNDAILKIQDEIAKSIKDNVNKVLGGEYFCGPTFDRSKDECPDFQFIINSAAPTDKGTRASFERINQAANAEREAEGKARAKVAEANGIAEANARLRDSLSPTYIDYMEAQAMQECAARPDCTLIFTTPGSNVNVNGGSRTPE